MENKENTIEKIDKVTETLIKELEGLNEEGLHEFFMFVYKMSHQHGKIFFYIPGILTYCITKSSFSIFYPTFGNISIPTNLYPNKLVLLS